ncbi:MAG: PEGA domain-containing protein [bacterium]|nr:PEGA domain-containing protein [bacterium]
MDRKRLVVILGSIILLILVILLLFYFFIYKGLLIISPQTAGAKVYLNQKVYSSFPARIKLKPGYYQAKIYKDGFLTQNGNYHIKAFQTLSSQPELKDYYLVNYIDKNNFSTPAFSLQGDYIYYYNSSRKVIQKIPAYYSKDQIDQIPAETISPELDIKAKKEQLQIIWSPSATKVSFISPDNTLTLDLLTKKIYSANGITTLTFTGEDEIYYTSATSLYKSPIDFTNPVKIKDVVSPSALAISPDKKLLAIGGNELEIIQLTDNATLKKLNDKISRAKWSDNNWLAFTQTKDDYPRLTVVSTTDDTRKDLGQISQDMFAWGGNNLIYLSKTNFIPKITKYNSTTNIKDYLYKPSMIDQPIFLLIEKDKIIFSTNKPKPQLIAINMD